MPLFILVFYGVLLLSGCGPSNEKVEQGVVEACLEGNARMNGVPKTVKESEAARKYCVDVYRGKYSHE